MVARAIKVHQAVPEICLWKRGHAAGVGQWIPSLENELSLLHIPEETQ